MSGPRRKSRMREMKPSRNREVVAVAAACKAALEVPPPLPAEAEAEVEAEAAFGSSRSGDPQVEDSTRPCRPCWEGWTFKEANSNS